MNRALIIKKEHLDKILSGEKVWEMRSRATSICEKIGLIESGSGLIVGECWLLGSLNPLESEFDYFINSRLHRVDDHSKLKKWKYPWLIDLAKRYDEPIPYKHPKGAVIWVKI